MSNKLEHLARLRSNIIDLSMRNQFLNYKLESNGGSKSVNLIGTMDSIIAASLMTGRLKISALPQNVSLKKDLDRVQIETRGKSKSFLLSMHRNQKLMINETGVNSLYLALGFVAWQESDVSDKTYSPICLVPALMDKITDDEYSLLLDFESMEVNRSFLEKMSSNFGIKFDITDCSGDPKEIIKDVSRTISGIKKDWRVEKSCALGFFDFTKIYLYNDINPSNIIANNLDRHPVIGAISGFDSKSMQQEISSQPKEKIENEGDLRLIYDADSSQHYVINRVINGESLIVEGPPGTGKSQTITNMIAALMMKGKRVLFVAEKKAALDVVRNRLERAGLSDFCLDIHQKISIASLSSDLEKRTNLKKIKGMDSINNLDKEIATQRDFLNGYVKEMNEKRLSSDISMLRAMTGASRWKLELSAQHRPEKIEGMPDLSEVLLLASVLQDTSKEVNTLMPGSNFIDNKWLAVDDNKSNNQITIANDIDRMIDNLEKSVSKIFSELSSVKIDNSVFNKDFSLSVSSDLDIRRYFETPSIDLVSLYAVRDKIDFLADLGRSLSSVVVTESCSNELIQLPRNIFSLASFFKNDVTIRDVIDLIDKIKKITSHEDGLVDIICALEKHGTKVNTSTLGEILSISLEFGSHEFFNESFYYGIKNKDSVGISYKKIASIKAKISDIRDNIRYANTDGFEKIGLHEVRQLLGIIMDVGLFSIFSKKKKCSN